MSEGAVSGMSLRAVVVAGAVAGLLGPAGPAVAACHAFTVSVSPSTVNEGGSVTVRVERDADVNPSAVRVRTVDGTAKAGSDYAAADRTVQFTEGTTESFVVATTNDSAREGAETFRVELVEGSGAGCPANPNFSYGPPATVTIRANDQPLPTSPPPATPRPTSRPTSAPTTTSRSPLPVVSSRPATTTTAPATPVRTTSPAALTMTPVPLRTSASPSAVPSDTASPTPATLADPDGGGLPLVPVALGGLALAALLGVAGFRLLRTR